MTDLEKLEQLLEDFKIKSETDNYETYTEVALYNERNGRPWYICWFAFNKDGSFQEFGEVS